MQIGVVLAGVGAYEAMRLAVRPDWPLALDHARRIAAFERVAHLAWEAPLQRLVLTEPALVEGMNVSISARISSDRPLLHLALPALAAGFRLFRNGFIVATGLALPSRWLFPTAPPRVAGLGLEDTLRRFSDIEIGSPGSAGLSDPVAAVPSLHAGWAVARRRRRRAVRPTCRRAAGRRSTRPRSC